MDVKYSKWTGNGFDLLNNSQDNKISLLYQIYPRVSYTVVAKNGSTKEPLFIAECKINEDNAFYGEGRSKQKAKLDAATAALKYFSQNDQFPKTQLKRTFSKDSFEEAEKKIKQEVPENLQNVLVAINVLFPKIQFSFLSEHERVKVCQVEVKGKIFSMEGTSKKAARMLVCGEIIKHHFGAEHLENINGALYVKKSFLKQNPQKLFDDALAVPRICRDLHPILFLNNIYRFLEYKDVSDKSASMDQKYTYTLEVENMKFDGSARSKKTAKLNCAINTINGLQEAGVMLEAQLEMAKLVRISNKKAKFDKYNKNKSLASNPRIKNMINTRNFKFTNFKKSGTLFDPNQGIMYASDFNEGHHHHHQDSHFHPSSHHYSTHTPDTSYPSSHHYSTHNLETNHANSHHQLDFSSQESYVQQQNQQPLYQPPQQPPHQSVYLRDTPYNNHNNSHAYNNYNQLKSTW